MNIVSEIFNGETLKQFQSGCVARFYANRGKGSISSVISSFGSLCMIHVDVTFRGIGQIFFANSPLAGLIVALAAIFTNVDLFYGVVLGSLFSSMGALFYHFLGTHRPKSNAMLSINRLSFPTSYLDGMMGYDASLFSLSLVTFFAPTSNMWLYLCCGCAAMGAIRYGASFFWDRMNFNVPLFTFVFNLAHILTYRNTQTFTFLTLKTSGAAAVVSGSDGKLFMEGVVRSVGQIVFFDHILSGAGVLLALLLSQPHIAVGGFVGSLVENGVQRLIQGSSVPLAQGLGGFNGALLGMWCGCWAYSASSTNGVDGSPSPRLLASFSGLFATASLPFMEMMVSNLVGGTSFGTLPFVFMGWMVTAGFRAGEMEALKSDFLVEEGKGTLRSVGTNSSDSPVAGSLQA